MPKSTTTPPRSLPAPSMILILFAAMAMAHPVLAASRTRTTAAPSALPPDDGDEDDDDDDDPTETRSRFFSLVLSFLPSFLCFLSSFGQQTDGRRQLCLHLHSNRVTPAVLLPAGVVALRGYWLATSG